ncbi:MAG: sugar phosphorylase [Pelolinea sp.]|nr:sugar phosphorylase [Pelolinea sp.]
MKNKDDLFNHLKYLYGEDAAMGFHHVINKVISKQKNLIHPRGTEITFSQKDTILITYPDSVGNSDKSPLKTLGTFLSKWVSEVISTIHILPFFPFSSDDGFSVIDYKQVKPEYGSWEDIRILGKKFQLMFDAVLNHISASSYWFKGFLEGERKYRDYFITIEDDEDLSNVFRPRELPLKTSVETSTGKEFVWTTFSPDHIDLNYHNPQLLLEMINTLLLYVLKGADYIRLDAVAYIWKEKGTNCIHLPQAHSIVQIFRIILNEVAPWVKIITETNVPHEDNISYFGNGENEAQLVYNFSLPPLVLHAFHTGNAETLSQWANSLVTFSKRTTFFNFLASHDGIGVMPARGILKKEEVEAMANRVLLLKGSVSYKNNADGTKSPYELNINYLDALCDPEKPDESETIIAKRFLASQAIMLALKGIPGIYFHSLFGSRNWIDGMDITGRARTINREKLQVDSLEDELNNIGSLRNLVFLGYKNLLTNRKSNPAFHPNGEQKVINLHKSVFSILRTSPDGKTSVICIHNVLNKSLKLNFPLSDLGINKIDKLKDLLSDKNFVVENKTAIIRIEPYSVLWLEAEY